MVLNGWFPSEGQTADRLPVAPSGSVHRGFYKPQRIATRETATIRTIKNTFCGRHDWFSQQLCNRAPNNLMWQTHSGPATQWPCHVLCFRTEQMTSRSIAGSRRLTGMPFLWGNWRLEINDWFAFHSKDLWRQHRYVTWGNGHNCAHLESLQIQIWAFQIYHI